MVGCTKAVELYSQKRKERSANDALDESSIHFCTKNGNGTCQKSMPRRLVGYNLLFAAASGLMIWPTLQDFVRASLATAHPATERFSARLFSKKCSARKAGTP
jgi:hypothetical protein